MRILQISPQIPLPLTDGGKKSINGLTRCFAARGHQIDFTAYRKHHDYKSALEELSRYCRPHILDVQTDDNILDAFFNLFSPLPYNISKFHREEMKNFLEDFLPKEKIDIAMVHNSHMAWVVDVIKSFVNIPVVLRQENVEMMIMKRFYETQKNPLLKYYAKLQYKKFLAYEPVICEKFDACIMISEQDKVTIQNFNPAIKAYAIPAGVDDFLFDYKRPEPEPYSIAHIGQLSWLPNLDSLQWFLEKILPAVVNVYPQTKLYAYGAGDYSKIKIPSEVKNNFIIKGFVADIWKEMEDKSLLVVPLRIGSGIRIKILEMLAFGQTIISTSLGKEGIELKDSEHILIADDENSFIEKIAGVFERKYDTELLGKNGRKFIKDRYLWDNIAQKFEELYLTLTPDNQ